MLCLVDSLPVVLTLAVEFFYPHVLRRSFAYFYIFDVTVLVAIPSWCFRFFFFIFKKPLYTS